MAKGLDFGIAGGGIAGGGAMAISAGRFDGTTRFVLSIACCSSSCAFLAFCSRGLAGKAGGLGGLRRGRLALARRRKLGRGLTSTLAMKIAATALTSTAAANHVRRTRRQRRPAGS